MKPGGADPEELLDGFARAASAQRESLRSLVGADRRARTETPGQYHLDTVADAAILPVLHSLGVRVLSEESGWSGPDDAAVTVVLDPVDGSTNCARGLPYWGISACAIDAEGMLCALVENGATRQAFTAIRGEGAWLDDEPLHVSPTRDLDRAVVTLVDLPARRLACRQFRVMGSSALGLCDVAAGNLDGFLDPTEGILKPWDYLGGLLVCGEAGGVVVDARDRDLVVADAAVRRQLVAAGTPELLGALREELAT